MYVGQNAIRYKKWLQIQVFRDICPISKKMSCLKCSVQKLLNTLRSKVLQSSGIPALERT